LAKPAKIDDQARGKVLHEIKKINLQDWQRKREDTNLWSAYLCTATPALIEAGIRLVPTEVIFSLNETGFSNWEKRKPKPMLIPTSIENVVLHDPVDRKTHRQRLLCCV
jgi:hypothetical protein